jgi:hypothetical protein
MRVPPSSASLRRLLARRVGRDPWSPDLLARLEAQHARVPKLWWHVDVVVPAQVPLVELALALGQQDRLSAALLDDLARAAQPSAVGRALQVLLRLVAHRPARAAWTSIRGAAVTMLHVLEGRYDPPGPVSPVLELPGWARPLCTPGALAEHGRRLDTCLGQRSWWRATARRQGMAYALERAGERATAWFVPDPTAGAALEMLTGPENGAVSVELAGAVQAALSAALLVVPDPFDLGAGPGGGPLDEVAVENARSALLDAVGPGSPSRAPVPWGPPLAPRLPGLPAARWTGFHEYFARPARFGPDAVHLEGAPEGPPESSVAWDERSGGLAYRTNAGCLTLFPTSPPSMRVGGELRRAVPLWFSTAAEQHAEPEIPEPARRAMRRFTSHLPLRVVAAAELHPLLSGLTGVWAMCAAPELLDLFEACPVLVGPVLERFEAAPRRLGELRVGLRGASAADAPAVALAWLGCARPVAVAAWLPRLSEPTLWSAADVRLLDVLLGDAAAGALLARLHRLVPGQVAVLHGARTAGLIDRVRPRLLHDVGSPFAGRWVRSRLEAGFAELALAREAGVALPGIRSLHHLARLLVQHRGGVPPALPACALPGPWGGPLPTLAAVGEVATELGHDPARWMSAAWAGKLCCVGRPGGVPAVTWLAPAGRRGALDLVEVLGWDGLPARRRVREAVERGLAEHHAALARLPATWTAADAVEAGLPMGVGSITLAGRAPLSELVGAVLSLEA